MKIFLILLIGFTGLICHPLNRTPQQQRYQKKANDKKGTIRIEGPWHSESALDRNVDPGEDTYVKKIISSNEGINFNKDMAEAGEMFDVNGIEDFYDKDAMITYEINGHEIPVHMRQKFTPQSKAMFPEYVKENPAAMGLTRQTKQREKSRHMSLSGFSDKDMPEYKVRDSPTLRNIDKFNEQNRVQKFIHSHGLPNAKYLGEGMTLPWKTAESSGHLNTPERETYSKADETSSSGPENVKMIDQTHRVSEDDSEKPKTFHSRLKTDYFSKQRVHSNDDTSTMYDKDNSVPSSIHTRLTKPSSGMRSDDMKEDLLTSSEVDHNQPDVGKNARILQYHHRKPEHSVSHESNVKEKTESSPPDALFSQLEQLHQSLDKSTAMLGRQSGAKHEEEVSSEHESVDPENVKAKARILSLLGELSDKLKGMEAVVTGNNHDKIIENFHKESPHQGTEAAANNLDSSQLLEGGEDIRSAPVPQWVYTKNDDDVEHNGAPISDRLSSSEEVASSTNQRHRPHAEVNIDAVEDDSPSLTHRKPQLVDKPQVVDDEKKLREEENKFDDNSYVTMKSFDTHHSSNKFPPETIERYREDYQPFIMNTASIDYHPAENDLEEEKNIDGRSSDSVMRKSERDQDDGDKMDAQTYHFSHKKIYERLPKKHQNNVLHNVEEKKMEAESPDVNDVKSAARANDESVSDVKGAEESRTEEVAESLADADDPGVLRERTYRPKASTKIAEDIEYPDYNEVKDAAIFETNFLRKKYHADKINWSDQLSDKAQQNAEKLARRADLDVNKLDTYKLPGENIAIVKFKSPNVGKDASDIWARESKNYDFKSPLVTKKNADFVQMMWKTDKQFGMGVAKSKNDQGWVVTSFFDTPYIDRYQDLKLNLQSDIPIKDPYSDIVG